MVVVIAIIKNGDYYLIGKRKIEQWMGGKYEFIGGKLEENESIIEALHREVYEEIGVYVTSYIPYYKIMSTINEITSLMEFFLCEISSYDLMMNVHDDLRWVKVNEILSYNFVEPSIDVVNKLVNDENLKKSENN